MATLAQTIETILLNRIASDQLKLPAVPEVALRVRDQLERGDDDFGRMAQTIGHDPMLAAMVLQAASTAAFGASRATSLVVAMTRLGAVRLMRVVIEAMTRQLFVSRDRAVAADFQRILAHSLAVARVADALARPVEPTMADDAYVVGLMHDLGKVVVGNTLLAAEHALNNLDRGRWRTEWMSVAVGCHRKIGAILVERWRLPEAVGTYLTLTDDFDAAAPRSVVNFARLANALVKRAGLTAGPCDANDVAAVVEMGKLVLDVDDPVLEAAAAHATEPSPSLGVA